MTDAMRQELVHLGNGAHALAMQILGNPEDAADAVHDSFAAALSRPGAYDAGKGPLGPWFLRIVRNRCIDALRRRRSVDTALDEIADPADGPEAVALAADRDRLLKRALASLAGDHREIIVLRDYMDLPYAEIAAVLDIAPGTVMSRLHRARLALAAAYRKYDDHAED